MAETDGRHEANDEAARPEDAPAETAGTEPSASVAELEERARRRTEERGLDPDGSEAAAILEALRRRDHLDANRAVAPLRVPEDARIITTDGNTFEDTIAAVVGTILAYRSAASRQRFAPKRSPSSSSAQ